jgi:hypothetical protein
MCEALQLDVSSQTQHFPEHCKQSYSKTSGAYLPAISGGSTHDNSEKLEHSKQLKKLIIKAIQ